MKKRRSLMHGERVFVSGVGECTILRRRSAKPFSAYEVIKPNGGLDIVFESQIQYVIEQRHNSDQRSPLGESSG